MITRLQSPEAPSSKLLAGVEQSGPTCPAPKTWWFSVVVGSWGFSMDMPPKDMKQTTVFFLGF